MRLKFVCLQILLSTSCQVKQISYLHHYQVALESHRINDAKNTNLSDLNNFADL